MSEQAGAFIMQDGVLVPDLDDEAMFGRQQLDAPKAKTKKAAEEVTNAEE